MKDPVFVLAVLALVIWVCEWLSRKKIGRNLGTALMVILLTAVLANLGLIPTASDQYPLYEGVFEYLAPISIFFLLLGVNLKELRKAGLPMLILFLIGSLATVIGVISATWLLNTKEIFGEEYEVLAGMFTGTYTGGSINFNAIAISYDFQENGILYAGAVAIDNVITTFWMLVTLLVPGLVNKRRKSLSESKGQKPGLRLKIEPMEMKDLIILAFLGLSVMWLSDYLSDISASTGFQIPSILILTTIALIMAQTKWVQNLNGSEMLGLYSVYIFLAVIGAYCEISAVSKLADVGVWLTVFTFIVVLVHGALAYGIGGKIFKDWEMVSVTSQANVGGGTTALALAETFHRTELLLPAILVGALGNAIGTYLGFLVIAIV